MENKQEIFKDKVEDFIIKDNRVTIRPLKEEDVEEVSKLEAKAFSMPWSAAAFLMMVTNKDSLYLVACVEDTPIGCIGVTNACGDGDINNVVVDEEYRGLGIGYKLLICLMEWGTLLGVENYTLEVRVSNKAAISLYEKAGFVSEGIRPGFYEKPREDAMIMWKRQAENG